jgi:hypothetical protein
VFEAATYLPLPSQRPPPCWKLVVVPTVQGYLIVVMQVDCCCCCSQFRHLSLSLPSCCCVQGRYLIVVTQVDCCCCFQRLHLSLSRPLHPLPIILQNRCRSPMADCCVVILTECEYPRRRQTQPCPPEMRPAAARPSTIAYLHLDASCKPAAAGRVDGC